MLTQLVLVGNYGSLAENYRLLSITGVTYRAWDRCSNSCLALVPMLVSPINTVALPGSPRNWGLSRLRYYRRKFSSYIDVFGNPLSIVASRLAIEAGLFSKNCLPRHWCWSNSHQASSPKTAAFIDVYGLPYSSLTLLVRLSLSCV
jgi:hypothetical protein